MPPSTTWAEWAAAKNAKARAKNRWREPTYFDGSAVHGVVGGRRVVSFSSNDYLGLSVHPAVVSAAQEALVRWGAGAGSARLLYGTRPVHHQLEVELAAWKGAEAALVFPSGYATNLGVLSALAGPGVLIIGDALNHASIIDGGRLASALGARFETYPHLGTSALEEKLARWPGRAAVVTDTVFSMDGDTAPVGELADLCGRYGALLVLDEAHAVLGPHPGEVPCEVLRVGTLSKTLGSQGGFVAGRREVVDLLVNRSRSFIFTTGLSPSSAAAALAALRVLRSSEGEELLASLRQHVATFGHESPIVPFVTGSEETALAASARLRERGFLVPAVRPPTVPPGGSRLRVSLSAVHSGEEVGSLLAALGELGLG